jgi:hypothetical protein
VRNKSREPRTSLNPKELLREAIRPQADCPGAISNNKEINMRKFLIAGALTLAVATPAFAANYFIVQNPQTKSCQVQSMRPTGSNEKILGDPSGYSSQTAAQTALKGLPGCSAM